MISTVTPMRPAGRPDGDRGAGRLIGERGDDTAVEVTEELHQVVAARHGDFGTPRLDGNDAEAGGPAKALRVDGFCKARRVKGGVQDSRSVHAGMRTGSDSMPRTKLE